MVQYETTKSIGTTEMKEMTDMSDTKTTGKNLETGNKVVINKNTKYSPISHYVITCLGKINVNIYATHEARLFNYVCNEKCL